MLSSPPYGYFVLFVEKGGEGLRMCINYRTFNSNTLNDAWLLPYINDLLIYLHIAKLFLELDLYDRYHQIPTHPSDYFKMIFVYCYRSFKYMVILFFFVKNVLSLKDLNSFSLFDKSQ